MQESLSVCDGKSDRPPTKDGRREPTFVRSTQNYLLRDERSRPASKGWTLGLWSTELCDPARTAVHVHGVETGELDAVHCNLADLRLGQ